jgi:methionine-rich copper-binding protein CopC
MQCSKKRFRQEVQSFQRTRTKLTLFFGEDILVLNGKNPNSISVTNSKGISVAVGSPTVSGTQVSQSLSAPLASGRYKVGYRIVSADGHVVSGSYFFTVK